MKTLIRHARILNPSTNTDQVGDVLLDGERIAQIAPKVDTNNAIVIDAEGLWLLPGLVDIHVHFGEPGQEGRETIATGTQAAAAGGVTSVVCMADTAPPVDSRPGVEFILERAVRTGYVRVYPTGALTKGMEGVEISPIGEMVEAGAVAISDDGHGVMNSQVLRRAMEYCTIFGAPIISHCEDHNLTQGGTVNEGRMSMTLGLFGIPREAEAILVARDILLAKKTGAHVHLAHISTAESVDLIRFYKKQGIRVTAEVTPHHLLLTDEAVDDFNTVAKINPPLRTVADQEALLEGLRDGTIDCIASDHSPQSGADKNREFPDAAFGVTGLETLLPLLLGPIRERLNLPLLDVLSKVTVRPAEVMKLPCGRLEIGRPADLTLWNPEAAYAVDVNTMKSKSRNSPFQGWQLQGQVEQTFIGGNQVYNRSMNEFTINRGQFLPL